MPVETSKQYKARNILGGQRRFQSVLKISLSFATVVKVSARSINGKVIMTMQNMYLIHVDGSIEIIYVVERL